MVEERRRLLLLSLFEQTRSFTSVTRREADIMPLMSAPADCTIDVTKIFFPSPHDEESPFPFPAKRFEFLKIVRLEIER